jgi:hypothetical protein
MRTSQNFHFDFPQNQTYPDPSVSQVELQIPAGYRQPGIFQNL